MPSPISTRTSAEGSRSEMRFFTGMDIAQVRALSRKMRAEADDIDRQVAHLTGQIQSAPWKGADRERYLDEWNHRHAAGLKQAAEALRGAASEAGRYADQQEWASKA